MWNHKFSAKYFLKKNKDLPANVKFVNGTTSTILKFPFNMLQLILLKSGGRMIYCGPLGQHSTKVIEYLEVSTQNGKSHFLEC